MFPRSRRSPIRHRHPAAPPSPSSKWCKTIRAASSHSTEEGEELEGTEDREAPTFVIKGLGQGTKSWREAVREESLSDDAEGDSSNTSSGGESSTWERVTQALGIGTWSYVTLGFSVFIILLNNTLGPGWLTRLLQGETFDQASTANIVEQRPFQVIPLDDPSNLLE